MLEDLLQIYHLIKKENPRAILTGSVALTMQNITLRKEPSDLDVHLPTSSKPFTAPEGFQLIEQENYADGEFVLRKSYMYNFNLKNIKIDVFQPSHSGGVDPCSITIDNIEYTHFIDIISYKLKHAFNKTSPSSHKHAWDIVFIMMNNTNVRFNQLEHGLKELFGQSKFIKPQKLHKKLQLSRPLIFFDVETTGTNKTSDRIIEIAAIKYFPNGETEEINQRINPQISIPAEASSIHGITNEDVADKPSFGSYSDFLYNFILGSDLAGYNIMDFDVPLLAEEFIRAGAGVPFDENTKYIDSLKIFFKNEKRDLEAAYKFYCNKSLKGAHAAIVDCRATNEILLAQVSRYGLQESINELHKLCNEANSLLDFDRKFVRNTNGEIVFNFGKNKNKKVLDERDYLVWMLGQDFTKHTKLTIRKIISGELFDLNIDLPF
jgi:DNA polymerase-3 subunit epsilon